MNQTIRGIRSVIITLLLGLSLVVIALGGCGRQASLTPVILKRVTFTAGGPTDMVFQPLTGYMYVTNGVNHVGVLKDMEEIAVLPTDRIPAALAADKKSGWIYVVNTYSDTVTVIQGTTVITTLETAGREPAAVAVEPASGLAYVVSPYRKNPPLGQIPVVEGNVTLISGTQAVGSIPLGDVLATDVIADPVGSYVYVSGIIRAGVGDTSDEVVVLKDKQIVGRFDIGPSINAMDVNPHTGDVYVLNSAIDRNLTQFRAGQIVATLKISPDDPNINSAFRTMRVHPVTGDIYAVDFVQHEAVVVRDMREIIGRAPVGLGPLKMTIDPVTENVYVANFQSDSVTVIHGTEVITTIETGWYPYGIGVNPTNGRVYVSNTNGDNIAILGVE